MFKGTVLEKTLEGRPEFLGIWKPSSAAGCWTPARVRPGSLCLHGRGRALQAATVAMHPAGRGRVAWGYNIAILTIHLILVVNPLVEQAHIPMILAHTSTLILPALIILKISLSRSSEKHSRFIGRPYTTAWPTLYLSTARLHPSAQSFASSGQSTASPAWHALQYFDDTTQRIASLCSPVRGRTPILLQWPDAFSPLPCPLTTF